MAEEYELKQVKVRLKLAEAEPLYSTEQITTPDKAAEVMAQVLAQMDREYCCVVNLDGANHPINFNVVSIGDVNQAHVPIQNVFKSAILSNASSIMMFHNHPSGSVNASREDIDVTKRLIEAGRIMNIPVLDHIIVGGGTAERFSFKEANPEMFNVSEQAIYSVREPDEAAYKLGDRYISIQTTDEGFDYSIYDESYHLLDGGVIDDPDTTIKGVLDQITEELKEPVYDAKHDRYMRTEIQGSIRQSDTLVPVDFDDLQEYTAEIGEREINAVRSKEIVAEFRAKTEELFDPKPLDGMTPAMIEEAVRERVLDVAKTFEMNVTIEDVIVSGSRCRGLENNDSDLDVVVSYSGDEREDTFFNALHDEMVLFGTVELDINPINTEQTGTLGEYLPGVEKYLADKAAQIDQEKSVDIKEPGKSKQVVTYTVAESSEFHTFGELHEGIPTLQEAIKVYEKLKHESALNAIPALGINLHEVGTSDIQDMQWDFLSGDRLDLTGLMYMPEMSQNEEVIEALHQMADKYPEVEIVGRFPDEPVQETSGPTVQKSEEITAQSLAEELDQFGRDFDLYHYEDAVSNREQNIAEYAADIESGNTGELTAYLQSIVEQGDGSAEDIEKAKELIAKLAEYKPLAKVEEREEQNYNMIDNVLNNLPQDPEEKREPAPQKEMRVSEVKKVRKRVSMKALLAEKKAEVAEREKKPPEVNAPSKRPSMGVDD